MPTAGYPDGKKAGTELEKIGGVVEKIAEKISYDETRHMFILGASEDLKRQSGMKMYMRDHI